VETPAVAPFCAASKFFVDAVAAVPRELYDQRWSNEWAMLDLIAHGNRANVLVVEYYERPVPVAGPEYVLPENIAERGRQAALDLGDDPADAVSAASERALSVVASAPDDATVGTPFGEQPFDAYLQSRTAELVLHGLDLDSGVEPSSEALAGCAVFLVERAIRAGLGSDVVRALSGRGTLRPGFNVY
jgi:hypothetical protein